MNINAGVRYILKEGVNENYTFISIVISDHVGTLPDDITSISVVSPSGDMGLTLNDFTFNPDYNQFYIFLNEIPVEGDYDFTVTTDTELEVDSDSQSTIEFLEFPLKNNFSPSEGATVDGSSPIEFEWELVSGVGKNLYYNIDVRDDIDPTVTIADGNRVKDAFQDFVPMVAGSYRWRVEINDHSSAKQINNQVRNDWIRFTVV